MKTLDEVIKALEDAPLGEFSEVEIDYATVKDALHYLKEYREEIDNIRTFHDDHIAMKNELAEIKNADNDSLTWSELRQMEGKPVWVERPEWKEWLLVSEIDEGKCEMYLRDKWGNGVIVNGRNIGYWRAYRKERE